MLTDTKIPGPQKTDKLVLEWNEKQLAEKTNSVQEQEFLYWVNYSRKNPSAFYDNAVTEIIKVYPQLKGKNLESLETDLKNSASLPMFEVNESLNKMAQSHSKDITSNNATPSHISTNGEGFTERFKKAGLKNCGGENIGFTGGDSNVLLMLVLLYLDINVPDLSHRKALLNPSFVETGIGISAYKNGNTFLVEDFSCSQK
ncbi:MAG TPA: CAP domain-containing protein [Parafilimonas sp.]|nr:CAP domain-containing protein [Parafilimonas sp.]